VILTGGADVTQTGAITRNLNVSGAAVYKGAVGATDVGGTVVINTTNVGMNTIRDVAGAATVTQGNLTANNVNGLLTLNSKAPITINITGNLGAGITFTTDNTVAFNDAVHTITGPVTITPAVAAGTGTIDASAVTAGKLLKIDGQIGDITAANKALKLLKADGGANIELAGGTAYIKKVDIGTQDVFLKLANAGDYKIEEFAHDNGKGTVKINTAGVTVLKAGTVLSAADKKLKEVEFAAGSALTVENGVNLFTVSGFKNGGVAGQGSLTFAGSSEVSGVFVDKIGGIDIQGGDTKVVKFNDYVKSGDITIANKGTVQFAGNVDAASIKAKNVAAANAGEGIVEFINSANIKVDATIGAAGANQIKTVKISNKDVEFTTAAFGADELAFTNNKVASTVKLALGVAIDNVKVTTVSTTEKNHNIRVSGDQAVSKAFGSRANPLGNLILDTDDTITITTADFFAGIDASTAGQGTVVLNKAGLVVGNIGVTNQMKKVEFQDNATVDIVNAKNSVVDDTKTATFTGGISGDKLTLGNAAAAGANAIFTGVNLKSGQEIITGLGLGDGELAELMSQTDLAAFDSIAVNSAIVTDRAGKSTATFNNSVVINKDLGESGKNLQLVDFSANNDGKKFEILTANIFADNTKFGKSIVIAGVPSTSAPQTRTIGKIEATDTTFVLSTNTFKITGGATSTASGNISVVTAYDGTNGGNIVIDGANTKLDFSKATAPTISLFDLTTSRAGIDGREFKWISATNSGTTPDVSKFTLIVENQGSRFSKWSLDKDTIKQADNTKEALTTLAKTAGFDSRNIEAFSNLNNTGDARAFIDDVAIMDRDDQKKAGEAIARLQDPINTTNEVTAVNNREVTNVVGGRLAAVAAGAGAGPAQQSQYTQVEGLGVAAGDEGLAARYGAWGMPFYSQATQKMRKGVSGYKAKTTGGIIGFDCQANDRMTVGAALTILRTDVKHKNIKVGDKTKVDMTMFSVYGLQQIADNWFIQGVASFGSGKVKNTEKRITSTANQTATGKYDTMTYGAEVLSGYNYRFVDNATVTPMFGLAYNKFNDSGYKETGTTVQNLSISKKSNDKIEAIIGARVAMNTEMSGVVVTPELHGFIRQDMRGKSAKMDIRLDGMQSPLTAKANKPAKTFYNLGCSITAKAGMFEYGAGYDAHLANKYVGHQGTLKVRVNF